MEVVKQPGGDARPIMNRHGSTSRAIILSLHTGSTAHCPPVEASATKERKPTGGFPAGLPFDAPFSLTRGSILCLPLQRHQHLPVIAELTRRPVVVRRTNAQSEGVALNLVN